MKEQDRIARLLKECPKLSSFPRKTRSFLVPGLFPYGSVTIIDGDPGLGKSNIAHFLAAQHSIGGEWPGGISINEGNTLIVDVENDPSYDTVPRLWANGGDVGNIQVVRYFADPETGQETLFTMPKHFGKLREWCEAFEVKLLIIDTIMGHIDSSIKANNDQDVRRVLLPLSHIAEELGICVVLLRHLNKSTEGAAVKRGSGSIAFCAVARNTYLVAADPHDEDLRHFVHVKTNTGKTAVGRTFRTVACEEGGCAVQWMGVSPYTANQLCRMSGIEVEQASDGPVSRTTLDAELTGMGFSKRSVARSLKALQCVPEKTGELGGGCWTWRLRSSADPEPDVITRAPFADD
jgi:putative DNA primase/helicase